MVTTMKKWTDLFFREAQAAGLECQITSRINGWPETMILAGKRCYTKSTTFQPERQLYFQGVDPKKLDQQGDLVILCGGRDDQLVDVFVIPWEPFFQAIRNGEAINTYKPPREYFQYKFRVRPIDGGWRMIVQGGHNPEIDVTQWHYDVADAIRTLS